MVMQGLPSAAKRGEALRVCPRGTLHPRALERALQRRCGWLLPLQLQHRSVAATSPLNRSSPAVQLREVPGAGRHVAWGVGPWHDAHACLQHTPRWMACRCCRRALRPAQAAPASPPGSGRSAGWRATASAGAAWSCPAPARAPPLQAPETAALQQAPLPAVALRRSGLSRPPERLQHAAPSVVDPCPTAPSQSPEPGGSGEPRRLACPSKGPVPRLRQACLHRHPPLQSAPPRWRLPGLPGTVPAAAAGFQTHVLQPMAHAHPG